MPAENKRLERGGKSKKQKKEARCAERECVCVVREHYLVIAPLVACALLDLIRALRSLALDHVPLVFLVFAENENDTTDEYTEESVVVVQGDDEVGSYSYAAEFHISLRVTACC